MPNLLQSNYKGFILAAGLGQRLRPLTTNCPKPLLPFAGVPLLYFAQYQLVQAGIKHLMVNAHYLPEKIEAALAKSPFPLEIFLSLEKEKILGTGGAFAALQEERQGAAVVAINGDIISDFSVRELISFHEEEEALATMALLPHPHPQETKIWCLGKRIVQIGGDKPPLAGASAHGFACLQVLSDHFLSRITEKKKISIIPFYQAALAAGETIAAFVKDAFWFDLGTPLAYFEAHRELLKRWQRQAFSESHDPLGISKLHELCKVEMDFITGRCCAKDATIIGPSLVAQRRELPAGTELGPFVYLGEGVCFEQPIKARHCLFLEQALFGETGELEHLIVDRHQTLHLHR